MGKQSIIVLNGQKYDALTGKRILEGGHVQHAPAKVTVFSDVIASPKTKPHQTHHKTPSTKVHQTIQPSKTLMRHAVKKPTPDKQIAHATSVTPKIQTTSQPKHHLINKVSTSPAISRFGNLQNAETQVTKSITHHAPVEPPKIMIEAQIKEHKITAEELIQKSLNSIKEPSKQNLHKRTKLRHKAAKRLKVSNRVINIAAGGMAVLLLTGFFAYQNIPNLAVRYAGVKAGVSATLPGYHPSAFEVSNSVRYSPGQVSITYTSNTDDRDYVITQKNTDWDTSELEKFMAGNSGKSPQSYATDEGVIYIKNENNRVIASTIENGVLKNLSGDSSLNTDQVIKIVSSM